MIQTAVKSMRDKVVKEQPALTQSRCCHVALAVVSLQRFLPYVNPSSQELVDELELLQKKPSDDQPVQ